MRLNDRGLGLLAMVGGLAVIAGTLEFRAIPGQQFGSAFFPRLLGGCLLVSGLLKALPQPTQPWWSWENGAPGRPVWLLFGLCLLWMWLSPMLGFLATNTLVVSLLAWALGASLGSAGLLGVGLTALLHLIFVLLLRVPLSPGVIEEWIR